MIRLILYSILCYFIYQQFIKPWAAIPKRKTYTRNPGAGMSNTTSPRTRNTQGYQDSGPTQEGPVTERSPGSNPEITFTKKTGEFIDFEEIK